MSTSRPAVCAGHSHREPARLGDAGGTEWWHCRSCGTLWIRDPGDVGIRSNHRPVNSASATSNDLTPVPAPAAFSA